MAWFRQLVAENIGMAEEGEVEEDAGKKVGENIGMAEEGEVEEDAGKEMGELGGVGGKGGGEVVEEEVVVSSSLGFQIWFAFDLVTTPFTLVRLHFCIYSHVASELVVFWICIEAN